MRKHIDYFYKCYDKVYSSEVDRICNESFNEYGYNFETNKRREFNYDELIKKTNYNQSKSKSKKRK